MLGYTKNDMLDHPATLITQYSHTGKVNPDAMHKAISKEWHLLSPSWVTVSTDFGAFRLACLGQQWIRFRSSLESPWLNPPRPPANTLLGD